MVNMQDFRSNSLCSSPTSLGHCVSFLRKSCVHLALTVILSTPEAKGLLGSNLLSFFMLQKLELSTKSFEMVAMKLTKPYFFIVKQNCVSEAFRITP